MKPRRCDRFDWSQRNSEPMRLLQELDKQGKTSVEIAVEISKRFGHHRLTSDAVCGKRFRLRRTGFR